jgi:hypothetical protein
MEKNMKFLFLAGFIKSIKSIKHSFPNLSGALNYTIQGESGYGRQLADALSTLHRLPSTKLRNLLPDCIADVLSENFEWKHEEIQRELDNLVIEAHDLWSQQDPWSARQGDFDLNRHVHISVDTQIEGPADPEWRLDLLSKAALWKGATQIHSQILPKCCPQHQELLRGNSRFTWLASENVQDK